MQNITEKSAERERERERRAMADKGKKKDGPKTRPDSLIPAPNTSVKKMMVQYVASSVKKSQDKKKVNPGGS